MNSSVANLSATATAAPSGQWAVRARLLSEGNPFTIKISSGKEEVVLTDVLAGEVHICSGQVRYDFTCLLAAAAGCCWCCLMPNARPAGHCIC